MSISSGYDKFKDYHQTEDGSYKLTSRWTSSNTVELDDGSTVEEKFTETDSKLSENTENIENLNAHASNKTNPHGVTKSQVGLGNVPNVATNDQTPTYSDTTTFATLTSGEKFSVAMAKIKLAITNLINHIANKSNPHGVTKSQVGLDNVDNTSDTDKPISTATQEALDTINSSLTDIGGNEITQAAYDALSDEEKTNGTYWITDADTNISNAGTIQYSNTTSGLGATNVQGAIDEIAEITSRIKNVYAGPFENMSEYLTTAHNVFKCPKSGWYYIKVDTGSNSIEAFYRLGIIDGYMVTETGATGVYKRLTSPLIYIKAGVEMVAQTDNLECALLYCLADE